MLSILRSTGAAVVTMLIFSSAAPQSSTVSQIDLPPQLMAASLRALGSQTGSNVLFDPPLVEGLAAPPVRGRFTLEEALLKVLAGTALTPQFLDDRTVVVVLAKPPVENKVPMTDASRAGAIRHAKSPTSATRGAATSAASGSESGSTLSIEQVVVTATKRAQNANDVPISITALGNAEIASRGLQGMGDYLASVPGVSFIETGALNNAIVMRGIDTAPEMQNYSAGTTVATYFGETTTTNSAGQVGGSGVDIKLVDIQRVEVLRGPQGTSFGNSSLGGAVRTLPNPPELNVLGAQVAVAYSQTGKHGGDNAMGQSVINLPLLRDRVAVRAVGYRFENSGYYENLAASTPEMQSYAASLGPQAVSLVRDYTDRGSNTQQGGRFALLWQASDAFKVTLSTLYQDIRQEGEAASQGLGDGYGYLLFGVLPSHAVRDVEDRMYGNYLSLSNVLLQYDARWADVVGTVSWTDSETVSSRGAGLRRPYDSNFRNPSHALSGELRLVSKLDGPLQFLTGVYHEKQHDAAYDVYGVLEIPALNPGYGTDEALGIFNDVRNLRQDALFGELSYSPREDVTLTVGGRHYNYRRDNTLTTGGFLAGTPLDAPTVTQVAAEESGNTFKANITYRPSATTMVYGGWAQGFRLGRPAPGLIPGLCYIDGDGLLDGTDTTIASTRFIDSDELDSYELGAKFAGADGRLNLDASVYYIDWTGLPTSASALCSGGVSYAYVANAGAARSQGLEVQASYRLTPALTVNVGGSFIDAELTKDTPEVAAAAGDRLPGSPRVLGNLGLFYKFDAVGRPAYVRLDSSYRGSFYSDFNESPVSAAGGYFHADVRGGVSFDNVDVQLFVNNVTDADDFTWRGTGNLRGGFGYRMRPRTVGLRLGYAF